jgi:hypothetical protein
VIVAGISQADVVTRIEVRVADNDLGMTRKSRASLRALTTQRTPPGY